MCPAKVFKGGKKYGLSTKCVFHTEIHLPPLNWQALQELFFSFIILYGQLINILNYQRMKTTSWLGPGKTVKPLTLRVSLLSEGAMVLSCTPLGCYILQSQVSSQWVHITLKLMILLFHLRNLFKGLLAECFHCFHRVLPLESAQHPFTSSDHQDSHSVTFHIFILSFQGDTWPYHKLGLPSCWPTSKFTLFSFYQLQSWCLFMFLSESSLPLPQKGRGKEPILIWRCTQWFVNYVHRMKERGWVSCTTLGCGSTCKIEQTKTTMVAFFKMILVSISNYMMVIS